MNCSEVKQRLENATSISAETNADAALQSHLQVCESCRGYAEELNVSRLLADIPVPPMSSGFADRALAHAWNNVEARPPQKNSTVKQYAWASLAASFLLATVLVTQWMTPGAPQVQPSSTTVVQAVPEVTHPVQIRLVSKEALANATITVTLDDAVALTGYPGKQTLSWQTAIAAGSNQLSLPVALKGNKSGTITVQVRSADASKEMRFTVEPKNSLAALLPEYANRT